jgi:hypothetical protein
VTSHPARVRFPTQGLSLALIGLGVLLRPNAIMAAPALAAYALWPARFEFKRTALIFLPAALAFYVLVQTVYYGLLHSKRLHIIQAIMVYDLGGITHFTSENQFPVQWSAHETALLTTKCYSPAFWDVYWTMSPCSFVMERLESEDDRLFGTPRLREAWQRAILAHPLAYLQHRASVMREFLVWPNQILPDIDWVGPDSPYRDNQYFQRLLPIYKSLEKTIVFQPWLWLALAGAISAVAWRTRAKPTGAFAVGITACAVIYMATFLPVSVGSDFRYAYWCVLAVLAAGAGWLSGWRERQVAC